MNRRVAGWAILAWSLFAGCGTASQNPEADEAHRRRAFAGEMHAGVADVELARAEVMDATFKELNGVYELLKAFHEWDKAVDLMNDAVPDAIAGKPDARATWSERKVQADAARKKVMEMTKARGDGKEFKDAMDKGRGIQAKLASLRERARKEME